MSKTFVLTVLLICVMCIAMGVGVSRFVKSENQKMQAYLPPTTKGCKVISVETFKVTIACVRDGN